MLRPGGNLTGLPIDQVDRTVQPTGDQRADLDALKAASAKVSEILATRGRARNRQTVASSAEICRAQTQSYSTAFPEQEIEKTVQLTEAQKVALDELRAAATKAPDLLKDTCRARCHRRRRGDYAPCRRASTRCLRR